MDRYVMSTLYHLTKHLQEQKNCDRNYDGLEHTAIVLFEIAVNEISPDYFKSEHNKEIWKRISDLYRELQ